MNLVSPNSLHYKLQPVKVKQFMLFFKTLCNKTNYIYTFSGL